MKYTTQIYRRLGTGGVAAAIAATLTLAACGSSAAKAPPQEAVNNSFQAIGSQSGLDLRISLGVSAAHLQQLGRTTSGTDEITPEVANAIASTSLVIDLNTGNGKALNDKQATKDPAAQFGLALQVGTASPVQVRYVGQTVYLRADAKSLLTDLGQDPSKAAGFQQALRSADSYVPGLAALGQGKWVSVPSSTLDTLLKGLQSKLPSSSASSAAPTPAMAQQLLHQLHQAFTSNATYTEVGTQGNRTHYQISLAVRPFVQQVIAALPASLGSVPGASSLGNNIKGSITNIPANQKAVVDVWVSNNKAQEIDIDLNQFVHKYSFAVPLRILIGPGTTVSAPSGATPLNLSKVPGLLGGLGALSGAGTRPPDTCGLRHRHGHVV